MTNVDPELLTAAGSFVGGTAISALVNAWVNRKKAPVERDSIIVTGAEKAVVALQAVVEAETARADRAEAKVAAMEARLDSMQKMLDEARDELHAWANNQS